MKSSNERSWSWKQADGTILKVVSNSEKGTIVVYNEKGKILLEKKNLSPEQVKIIELNFLNIVSGKEERGHKKTPKFDPMIS